MATSMNLVPTARGILFQENKHPVSPGFRVDRMVRSLLAFAAHSQLNLRTLLRWSFSLAWVLTTTRGGGQWRERDTFSSKIATFDMFIQMVQSFITGDEHPVLMYILLYALNQIQWLHWQKSVMSTCFEISETRLASGTFLSGNKKIREKR